MIISVIGGGPVGSYFAGLVKGDVRIYEEHKQVGVPVQCSGIFTHNISELVKISDDFLINRIKGGRLISPSGLKCEFELRKKDYVFDREKFDKYLWEKALEKGVQGNLGVRYNGGGLDDGLVVGADGPFSEVRKKFFGNSLKRFWVAKQMRVKMKNDGDVFEVYFDEKGRFSWIVPENQEVVRIASAGERGVEGYFDNFVKKFKRGKVLEVQGGVIPRYDGSVKLWDGKRSFLLGDSAGMVKALSGGGIVPAFRSAKILSECISSGKFGNYEKRFCNEVGKGLGYNLMIKKFLEKLDEKEIDYLIKNLEKYGFKGFDRDDFGVKDFLGFVRPEFFWLFIRGLF